MDKELETRLAVIEQKIDAAYHSAEKTRKYLLWTLIISVAMIVLPLIGMAFVLPKFIGTLGAYQLF
jgi:type IV secretory pathway component VirB8